MVLAALVLVVVQQGSHEADQGQGDAEKADEADEGLFSFCIFSMRFSWFQAVEACFSMVFRCFFDGFGWFQAQKMARNSPEGPFSLVRARRRAWPPGRKA